MSNVLVIHPDDRSTDFLKYIYKDKDYDVITDGNISLEELIEQIEAHDKIIMLGHGTSSGLINPQCWAPKCWDKTNTNKHGRPYVINFQLADLLRTKETISIWCHSDKFFEPHGIPGFHTGMIISETAEQAYVLGKVYLDTQQQLYNMLNFAKIVGQCIERTPEEMKDYILEHYNYDDPVTKFNRDNIKVLYNTWPRDVYRGWDLWDEDEEVWIEDEAEESI